MTKDLKPGDAVAWNSRQGRIEGRVVGKQVTETSIKGHKVAASKDDPQFIVESEATGARAAHRPAALKRRK